MNVVRPATTSVLTVVLFSESLKTFSNIVSTFLFSFPAKPVEKYSSIVTFYKNNTIQKTTQTCEQIMSCFRRFDKYPFFPAFYRAIPLNFHPVGKRIYEHRSESYRKKHEFLRSFPDFSGKLLVAKILFLVVLTASAHASGKDKCPAFPSCSPAFPGQRDTGQRLPYAPRRQ